MIIDCISDLHGHYPNLEGGDLLIVAGDLTAGDTEREHDEFGKWLAGQRYRLKIFIAGNHDNFLRDRFAPDDFLGISYLCDSGTEFSYHVDGFPEEDEGFLPSGKRTLKIWGSPWTKTFPGMNPKCRAFTVDMEEELAERWALIPDDMDILITHSPAFMCLDSCVDLVDGRTRCVGSKSLEHRLQKLEALKLHVFGHIHEQGGRRVTYVRRALSLGSFECVNASHVNERYEPVNRPIRIE